MRRRANCYDNTTMESFWSTLKLVLSELSEQAQWPSCPDIQP